MRALFFIMFVLFAPLVVQAQSNEDLQKASLLFEQAETFYQVQDYTKALELYKEAYVLSKAPELLFNLGQCYRLLGKKDEAIRAYNNFLRSLPEDSPLRPDVVSLIETTEKLPEPTPETNFVKAPKERVRVFDLPPKELARVFLVPEILVGSFVVLGTGSLVFDRAVQNRGNVSSSLRVVGFSASLAADISWVGAIATFALSYKKKNDQLRLAVDPLTKTATLSFSFGGTK